MILCFLVIEYYAEFRFFRNSAAKIDLCLEKPHAASHILPF